jgi:predicted peroxiredoxin
MPGKFVVSLTFAKDNPDKATVAFVIANASAASGQETVVFLTIEGVRLATPGYADDLREEGFAPLKDLMACSPCFKRRKLDETKLVAGAKIVGGAKLVEFMAGGCPSISF